MRVDIPDAVHAKLRILAAEAGLAMSAFVRGLAENAVRERFPEVFVDQGEGPAPAPAHAHKRTAKHPAPASQEPAPDVPPAQGPRAGQVPPEGQAKGKGRGKRKE